MHFHIDKLYNFVLESGKRFPGQFIDTLMCITGPYVSYVNELTIKLKNYEADEYDKKLKSHIVEEEN